MPLALLTVIVGLVVIQSWSSHVSQGGAPTPAVPPTPSSGAKVGAPGPAPGSAAAAGSAKLVRGTNFTIAVPAGWKATTPDNGATFSAVANDGGADATLWVRNEPKLDFPTFEASSLAQLRNLAGSAHVAGRASAPTPDETVVRLAADAPAGKPAYEVTLRVSGPYRYYLATTLQPNASSDATKGVQLLENSLTPVSASSGGGK